MHLISFSVHTKTLTRLCFVAIRLHMSRSKSDQRLSAASMPAFIEEAICSMAVTVLIATFWLLATAENLNSSGCLRSVLPIARRVLGTLGSGDCAAARRPGRAVQARLTPGKPR